MAYSQNQKRFTDVGYKIFCCYCEHEERRLVFFGEGTQVDALAPFLERDALEQLLKVSEQESCHESAVHPSLFQHHGVGPVYSDGFAFCLSFVSCGNRPGRISRWLRHSGKRKKSTR